MKNNHKTIKQERITKLKKESAAREQAEKERDRLFNLSIDMLCIAGFDGYFKQLNPAWEKTLGWTNAELMAKPYLDYVHPEDREPTIKAASGLADGKTIITFENRYLCKNGIYKWISWNSFPMVEEELIFAVARDITQRKQMEEELNQHSEHLEELVQKRTVDIENVLKALHKSNRALKTLSECNQALVRAGNESDLLNNICEILADHGGYRMAWIAFPENDENKSIRPVAQKGYEEGYLNKINITWADNELGRCPSGTAIRTQQIAVFKDVASDPNLAPWREEALQRGYASVIALPLISDSEVLGALVIHASEPDAFDAAEISLLTEFANDLAYGIKALRIREAHEKAEEALLSRDAKLQLQFNRLNALRTIDQAIAGSIDIHIVLNVILDQIGAVLQSDAMDVLLLNPHSHQLEFAAERGFHTNFLQHTQLSLGEGYAGRAALERRIIHIPNLQLEKNSLKRAPMLSEEGVIAYYGSPLFAKGQVKGVLEIFYREPLNPDQDWLDFLESLSGQAAIAIDNATLFSELQQSTAELIVAYDRTLEGWSNALDLRDQETEGHTLRVTELTLQLARALGVSEEQLVHIRRGALLHDIGKMGIPDSILLKPGALTEEEWVIMRKHPVYAYELLSPIAYLRPALDIPYCHHEKWDGSGYPRGLKKDQIPFTARIFAIIDVWDAVRSDRPYRPAWPEEKAIDYLRNQSGKHFDPKILDIFLGMLPGIQISE